MSTRHLHITQTILAAIGIITFCLLIGGALGLNYTAEGNISDSVTAIHDVTYTKDETSLPVTLPFKADNFSSREKLKITFNITPASGDMLYVKTVYAPLSVYADGELIYSFGKAGTYPSFFADPPTEVAVVSLPASRDSMEITMVYEAPSARNSMVIASPLLGSDTAILRHLMSTMGLSLAFSIIQIFLGILLLFNSIFFLNIKKLRMIPLSLAMLCISTGVWTFSECNLTVFLTNNPSLLYMLAFIGLFSMPVHLYNFAMEILDLHENRILQPMVLIQGASLCAAIIMQLTGTLPFSVTMYYFHILIPFSICLLAGVVLHDGIRHRNPMSKKFFLPFFVLGVSSVLELTNYQLRFTSQLSSVFQLGIMVFVIISEVLAGNFIKDSMYLKDKNRRLSFNVDMLQRQIEMQKERNTLVLKNEKLIREQRHDLKHQYAVIRSFCNSNDYDGLQEYLDSLLAAIPENKVRVFCKNTAVNSIVSYYIAIAEKKGIETTVNLTIPSQLNNLGDNNLCVILGNLLENAIEACENMSPNDGRAFLRLSSRVLGDTIYITMDNSFNGEVHMDNGEFISHKRNETGTGLLSICSVTEQHEGYADFKYEKKVFLSNIVVRF